MALTWTLCFSLFSLFTTLSHSCQLFWSSRQSLGYGQGVQLQFCCNVSKVQIWAFDNVSNFSISSIAFEKEITTSDDEAWTELQLSVCSDRSEPTIGWVGAKPGVTCEYKRGDTVDILPTALTLPGWFVVCYILEDGCKTCSLEAICDNELSTSCADIHVIGSSPTATNGSIDYWVKTGLHYPFTRSSEIVLTVTDQRTKKFVATQQISPTKNMKSTTSFDGLQPNHVYNVRRCLAVTIPPSLLNDPRFEFSPKNELCVEEGFRTERNAAGTTVTFFALCLFVVWSVHV